MSENSERTLKLGKLVCTVGINDRMKEDTAFHKFIFVSLGKYINCDWGDICAEDKTANDAALISGDRILAVYIFRKTQEKIWIITESDRSVTTILFPSEY